MLVTLEHARMLVSSRFEIAKHVRNSFDLSKLEDPGMCIFLDIYSTFWRLYAMSAKTEQQEKRNGRNEANSSGVS